MSLAEFARFRVSPLWTWLTERIWIVEHAFEHAKAQRREQDTTYRIFFVLVLFSAAFATLALGAVGKALFSGDGRGAAGVSVAGSARADLVDRNGRLLAVDLVHYGAYLDPRDVWDKAETRRVLAAALPDMPASRLAKALSGDRRAFLVGGLTPEEKQRLHDLGLPGLNFEAEDHRVYPLGSTAAHLIGITDTGGRGLSGAENALDKLVRQNGPSGDAVPLSIDLRIQAVLDDEVRRAAQEFQVIGASGLVVDIHTGEILAMTSYPDFDPNHPGRTPQVNQINHAVATVYEPGSIMKVFTVAMGLDAGVVKLDTLLDARTPLQLSGQTIHDYDKDNSMLPLWKVFTHSSNIASARLAMMVGGDRMEQYFRSFGLYAAAPSELKESARPITPRKMTENTVATMAFGHAISVTPLAMATGMTAVLNGGEYVPLSLRKGGAVQKPEGRRVVTAQTSRTMLDLMRLNVLKGTGRKANAPGLRVGGKTGSAEKVIGGRYVRNKLVSSFAAVFPTDGPPETKRYFVLIMMDEPHATKETSGFATGGWTAAPAAGRVIDRIAPYLGVDRIAETAAADNSDAALEDLAGGEH